MNLSVLDVYRHFFAARTDVYSQWTPDGWRPVREEMTPEVIGAALAKERPSISGYMITPGSTTHVAAYDLDLDDGYDLARALAGHLRSVGVPSLLEPSRRGAHLWLLLDESAPAKQVRAALTVWALDAGMPHDPEKPGRLHPKVELRPAVDSVGEGKLGSCLRMPMMPHPLTGQRHRLERWDGSRIEGALSDVLLEAATMFVRPSSVADAAMRWTAPVTRLPRHLRDVKQYPEDDDDRASASEILHSLWGVPDPRPGRVSSCPATQYHSHGDVHKGLSILPDDKRAICHKPGCILNNDSRGRGTWELRTMAPVHA